MRLGLHGLGDEKAWGLAMFKVRFTPQALNDLEEIKRYISGELFNPQAAWASECLRLIVTSKTLGDLFPSSCYFQLDIRKRLI